MATSGYNFDPAELDKVLAQVEQELAPVLKSEAARLAKAKDDEGSGDEGGSEEGSEGGGEGGEGGPPEASASPEGSAPPSPEGSAPPPPGPGAEGSAPPPGPEASASPGGMPQDPAAIAQMIQQLPPEILKTVYLAAKQALFAQMGGGAGPEASAAPGGAPPPAGGPGPGAAPGPEASASPGGAPPMPPPGPEGSPAFKGEMSASPGNGGKSQPVKKSESNEVAVLKAEIADMKKSQAEQMDLVVRAVQKLAGTPVRKAVTSISHIAKTEGEQKRLSKAEVNAKLKEKARNPSLAKKDRAAINRFYDEGSQDITIVAHLLKE